MTRRKVILGAVAVGVGGVALVLRRKLKSKLAAVTQRSSFSATPPLVPHDPTRDRAKLYVARGGTPADNVDSVLSKLGGIGTVVGEDDVVVIKVSAQWWNQGMTNVAAVKRVIEHVLERPGFKGEVIVFENTHFRMPDGSGLSRAWVHPSERNVDVPGWNKMGDLITHFNAKRERERARARAPVSFVGLVDAGLSSLTDDEWMDPGHTSGKYGGDDRGPIAAGDDRDGYHWDFSRSFRLERSWVDEAMTPLTWPRFTSPLTGIVVDFADGLFRRDNGKLARVGKRLVWINMTTANEHGATGFTGACKSTMGIVDMSAGALGTHPLARGYASIHYFGAGSPKAQWRMAGPLAYFARVVRKPDLILTVAEWVGYEPVGYTGELDLRIDKTTCANMKTIIAGTDPVAIDTWAVANLMADLPVASKNKKTLLELESPDSTITKFLRYYRQVYEAGTLDPSLIAVV